MKNNRIQFWRIIFTFLIAFFHFNKAYDIWTSWYIGVEFFFILSGYLLVKKTESSDISAAKYTFDKVKRFFPHCFLAFWVIFGGHGVINGYTPKQWGVAFVNSLNEIFFVQSIGLNNESLKVNGVTWYLSVLLIVGYFMWYMLKNHKKIYVEVIAPFLVLSIYAYLYRTYGNLAEHDETVGFLLNSAVLRGVAAMNCGVLCFYFRNYLMKLGLNKRAKDILIILSDICFICVFIGGAGVYRSAYDYLFVFLLALGVTFAFVDEEPRWYFNNKAIDFLGSICLSIYLNHNGLRVIFKMLLFKDISVKAYIIYFLVITIYSACTYYCINKIVEIIEKCWKKHMY